MLDESVGQAVVGERDLRAQRRQAFVHRAAGATGWLVKPFDPNKLIEVIQKVIR